jgi:hypothetical protein
MYMVQGVPRGAPFAFVSLAQSINSLLPIQSGLPAARTMQTRQPGNVSLFVVAPEFPIFLGYADEV